VGPDGTAGVACCRFDPVINAPFSYWPHVLSGALGRKPLFEPEFQVAPALFILFSRDA